jgi:hypothetical protein
MNKTNKNKNKLTFRTQHNFATVNNPLRRTKHFAHNKHGHGRRTTNKNFNPNNYMRHRLQYYSNTFRNIARNKTSIPPKLLNDAEKTNAELEHFLNAKKSINERNGLPRDPPNPQNYHNRRAGSLNRIPMR